MKKIKGWRERLELPASYQLTCASAVERTMEDEIADLRASRTANDEIVTLVAALMDGGRFDLTDSPKSFMDAVRTILDSREVLA